MKRRKFIIQSSVGMMAAMPAIKNLSILDTPFFTTGIKIGEITPTSAVVWARLTQDSIRVKDAGIHPMILYWDDVVNEWHDTAYFDKKYKMGRPDKNVKVVMPEGYTLNTLDGAVPGIAGQISVKYRAIGTKDWQTTKWVEVESETDYATQFNINHLASNTKYEIQVLGKTNSKGVKIMEGSFSTAPKSEKPDPVNFMVTTCHEYSHQDDPLNGGFKIFGEMQKLNPQFLVHTGDVLYHDHIAKNLDLAKWNWQKMNGLPTNVAFYRNTPCYFMKDDHDTWMNDCHSATKTKFMGEFTFNQGAALFKQQVPHSEKSYRTFRWGKDVQIWLFDGRDYRMPNEMPDGIDKTIWGKEQLSWFKDTYKASDATFKILISPTPIIGPDRPQKRDNHANSNFKFEGDEIRGFIQGDKNTFVVCGDRHWQYVSKHLTTGTYEFACGPASDEHAGGWKKDEIYPEHEYLNIVGGFLQVQAQRINKVPTIQFTHYSVDGKILHQKQFLGV
jgi:alkaline phosphatase D